MTVFSVIANGCSLVDLGEHRLLIDPWCVGDLYCGSWSCYPTPRHPGSFVAPATDCFISHLHEDHCDPETLRLLPRSTRMLVPERYPNHVLRQKLEPLGFTDVLSLADGNRFALDPATSLFVVPPLNAFGQEARPDDDPEDFTGAIDSGLVIERRQGPSIERYLVLGDNTPYDAERFIRAFPGLSFDLLFFPYNGFADDYPLCYDDLTRQEKKDLSAQRSLKREAAVIDFCRQVEVRGLVPYSSDFALNGPRRAEFFDIHPPEFLHKDLYATRIERRLGVPAYALYEGDSLVCQPDAVRYVRQSSDADRRYFAPKAGGPRLTALVTPSLVAAASQPGVILSLLQAAAQTMFAKCERSLGDIAPWELHIAVERLGIFAIDFARKDVKPIDAHDGLPHRLILTIGAELLLAHLSRTLHWNNSQIGCYLTWRRRPNFYNGFLYTALNFLHLPRPVSLEAAIDEVQRNGPKARQDGGLFDTPGGPR